MSKYKQLKTGVLSKLKQNEDKRLRIYQSKPNFGI